MKKIVGYISAYYVALNKRVWLLTTLFAAALVFINYYFGLDGAIRKFSSFPVKLLCWYGVFGLAFIVPYLIARFAGNAAYRISGRFLFLLLLAPALFALKLTLHIPIHLADHENWNRYWNQVLYWPLLVVVIGGSLLLIWKKFDREQPFYGCTTRQLNGRPYFIMLLVMAPLVAAASTQPDFLAVYPKLKLLEGVYEEKGLTIWHKVLFELSYGTDFITIELFFRGFLVLAFIKWVGKDAILAMACFYCTIHFGKPMGECISSYFGGLLLGIVVYNTRSIYGGLMVHLGIAWMMELGGYLGNSLF